MNSATEAEVQMSKSKFQIYKPVAMGLKLWEFDIVFISFEF